MNDTQQLAAFTATVEASIDGLNRLLDTLQAEQQAMGSNKADALERIVAQKAELLAELEHSIKARNQLQRLRGLERGLEAGDALIDHPAAPAKLPGKWQTLKSLSEKVMELNRQNGQLAMLGERNVRNAISLLTGRPQEVETYSRNPYAGNNKIRGYSIGRC